jgi:hypothetical protein
MVTPDSLNLDCKRAVVSLKLLVGSSLIIINIINLSYLIISTSYREFLSVC